MLELLVQQILYMAAKNSPDPRSEVEGYRRRVLEGLRSSPLLGSSDPAASDLMMQLVEEQTDALFRRLLDQLPR